MLLSHVVDVMFDCIGFITIQVCCRECMVMRCLHVSSYIWAILFCIWILFVLVLMFFQGLHSCVEIFMRGMFRGGGICWGLYFGFTSHFQLWCFHILYVVFGYSMWVLCLCCVEWLLGHYREIIIFVEVFLVYIVPFGSIHWHRYTCWFFLNFVFIYGWFCAMV